MITLQMKSFVVPKVTYSKGGCLHVIADHYGMDRTPNLTQKFVAEMLGVAFLVWIGAGSITVTNFLSAGKVPLPFSMAELGMIALAFAFAIAAMIYTIGHISGCHINPAVTFSFAVTRRIGWGEGEERTIERDIAALGLDPGEYEIGFRQQILDDMLGRTISRLNRLYLRNADGSAMVS